MLHRTLIASDLLRRRRPSPHSPIHVNFNLSSPPPPLPLCLALQAFSAFTNDVIWLIVVSFFFARVSRAWLFAFCLAEACQMASGAPRWPPLWRERAVGNVRRK